MGQYRRGLTAARVLVRDAEALTYRPLVADALHLEGLGGGARRVRGGGDEPGARGVGGGGESARRRTAEVVLADAEEFVGGIFVDDTNFYWAESSYVGSIRFKPK